VSQAQDELPWTPVDAGVLEGMRGGFTLGSGLVVSFGIERLVSIDGSIVSRTSLQIPDLSRLGQEQAEQTREALSSVKLIQSGHDNIYADALSAQTPGGIVIQNSLNDKAILSQTVISAGVNSMALLQALLFQHRLDEAIARAAESH
jgi:hypothetical protein